MTSFKHIFEALSRGEPLMAEDQVALSDLAPSRVPEAMAAWETLGQTAQLRALETLTNLALHNLRLDFNALYCAIAKSGAAEVRAAAIRANGDDQSVAFFSLLLDLLQHDPSPLVRAAAAAALAPFSYRAEIGQLDEDAARELEAALIEAVQNPAEALEVRREALASLGYFSSATAQELVQDCLAQQPMVRAAIRALGRSADPTYLDQLLAFSRRTEPDLRAEAATAFGEIEDQRALPRLLELVDDPAQEVRVAAVRALGHLGGERAREALLYAAEDPDPAVAQAAQQALEEITFFEEPLSL